VPAAVAHTVLLQIRGLTERLIFEEGTDFVLGRLDLNQAAARRYDLTRFGAHERGVSREHARLNLKNNQLTVTDLGSINGTSVNRKKLKPNEPHVLSSGDELMLGRLSITLRFEPVPDGRRADAALVDDTQPTLQPVSNAAANISRPHWAEKIETKEIDQTPDFTEAPTEKGRPTDMPPTSSLAALQEKKALRANNNGAAASQSG
jgi:predicted component of type VI protein secretion system